MSEWNVHHISPLNIPAFSVQHKDTFTCNTRPYLTVMVMQMITYVFFQN